MDAGLVDSSTDTIDWSMHALTELVVNLIDWSID